MSNRFTIVPPEPVPPLGRLASLVMPCADAFMVVLLSRPERGSLRNVWVTPATFWMSFAMALVAGALSAVLWIGINSRSLLGPAAAVILGVLALGAASVALVGGEQRRRAVSR
jgi:hypothetical protein